MGSGVPSGLQNQHEGLRASQVGSIPTLPRQKKALSHEDSAFLSFKFAVESLMWIGQNLKAIVSNIIHQTFLLDFSSVLSAISFVSPVLTASLNSRRLLPKARPIVGSFPGPNTTKAIIKMSSNSGAPKPNIAIPPITYLFNLSLHDTLIQEGCQRRRADGKVTPSRKLTKPE
jgi:hypothetical protein